MTTARQRVHGFAAPDLAATVVVVFLIAALVALAGDRSRRQARLGEDLAKLRFLGTATGSYAADHAELFWTFSWKAGQSYQTQYPELNGAASNVIAAARQLVYILRTHGERPDMPVMHSIMTPPLYSTVVLAVYLDRKLPWQGAVSAEDRHRLNWSSDPACFDQGCFLPNQPMPDKGTQRWPYSASFSPPMAFADQSPIGGRAISGGTHYSYMSYAQTDLGGSLLPLVSHPSQKVLLHDQNARHFGARQPYCTHDEARLPLLFVDGSVSVRAARDANPGWNPNQPMNPAPTTLIYSPRVWEPPAINPGGDTVIGRFRWTRNGIGGRDFGGPEVPGL